MTRLPPRSFRGFPPVHALALLALLAACGTRGAIQDRPPASPEEAACRAEARSSPELRTLFQRQPPPDRVTWREVWQDELRATEARLVTDCLRRDGIAAPGGVEPTRRNRIDAERLGSPLR
ncbi:phosphoribosylamine--glycine ligase [Roseomonas sp. OT10]|uniref:phosphoribosylamine--glycine ligase n=1 Tax=Roseomonas cutis TaxID=2897332 RepID=UPI001E3E82B4|nr:phosphoribosylamine--glycine ligase [Roseomonas sp. OT10]UFN49415.1 phosphoribosylamine--glycine ligase [Roseomonas sp. OT10]